MADDEKKVDGGEPIMKNSENDPSKGPVKKRKCTDILFCILFIVHWLGFLVVAIMAFMDGNPIRLYTPRNSSGKFA